VHVDDSCLQEVPSNNITGLVPGGLSVQHVQPARVTQYIRTQLTVVLNGSLCQQLGKVRMASACISDCRATVLQPLLGLHASCWLGPISYSQLQCAGHLNQRVHKQWQMWLLHCIT
jgi:hypothetical protein